MKMESVLTKDKLFSERPVVSLTNTITYAYLELFVEMGSVEECIKSFNIVEYNDDCKKIYPHLTKKLLEMGIIKMEKMS